MRCDSEVAMDSLPEQIAALRDRKVELDECNNNSRNESHLLSKSVSALGDEALSIVTVPTKGGDVEKMHVFDGSSEKVRCPSAGSVRSAKSSGVTWNESVVEHSVQSTTRYSKDEDGVRPRRFFSIVLSCIYGVFVFTMGSTFCVTDRVLDEFHAPEIFSIVIASVGMSWLALFHVDILRYKHSASRQVRSKVRPSQSGLYVHSAASVFSTYARKTPAPELWFLSGRHSGSFYLKGGMVAVMNETVYTFRGNHSNTNGGPMLNTIAITPYLHPFTIEYNIILAGVWFIVWQNVGTEPSHHFARRESVSESSAEQQHDASYHSNLVVSADCHAANKGLFAGIFLLLTAIVSLVIGQVAFSGPDFDGVESIIFLVQDTCPHRGVPLAVVWGYVKISKLDCNVHPITLLDDVLLYVPLPFYFVYYIMSVTADVWYWNFTSVVSHLLTVTQVVVQTIFLSDWPSPM
ncbi:hypothetical protein HPB50_016458 [Hyalomma asiaticum]|uniref:Uncharacterized protein n=1 Tax=Hyalomma asiaticum TaxID=266040 RepID=A0ACB7SNU4_HYAAI|nr:hypothetical protein HPB50_016458 [Hyalomma asiaticum]